MNMKTIACLTASIAATAAFADIEVQLGVTEVTSEFTNTIVAVPYTGFESGQDITVSNVVKTANLVAGDLCYVMRTDGSNLYDAWELKTKSGGILQWEEVSQVSVTGGVPVVAKSPSPCTTTLTPGSALWIVRKAARSAALSSTPFYLWGTYDSTKIPQSTVNVSSNGTWNIVANCGSEAKKVSQLISKLGTIYVGDMIVIPDDGKGIRCTRITSTKWSGGTTVQNTEIQPGMGCWVFKKNGPTDTPSSFKFSW